MAVLRTAGPLLENSNVFMRFSFNFSQARGPFSATKSAGPGAKSAGPGATES